MRIQKVRNLEGGEALTIGASGQRVRFLLQDSEEDGSFKGGNWDRAIAMPGSVSLRRVPAGWSIVDTHGFRTHLEGKSVSGFAPLLIREEDEAGNPGPIMLNGKTFPGSLRLVPRTDAGPQSYDVVNLAPLESYLPGVLTKEIYGHWNEETHAAQAISARSFACSEIHSFRKTRHYDVSNNASSQMYGGADAHSRAVEGVTRTRGLVLGWKGLLVPGYYSACCGGLAADARHAIGQHPANDIAPLRGRAGEDVCTSLPVCRWSVERSANEVLRRLQAYGKDRSLPDLAALESIASLEPADLNEHERPIRYTLADRSGRTANVSEHTLRRGWDYAVRGYPSPEKRLRSGFIGGVTMGRRRVVLNGRGWGHGAGLCQYGAEQLAKEGKSFQEILNWYYPGADIVMGYS